MEEDSQSLSKLMKKLLAIAAVITIDRIMNILGHMIQDE
jgi:hypothetical protein